MDKKKITLAAFDLDGTLLDDKKRIPPENLRLLRRAAMSGVLLVPATGRIPDGMPEELMRLPIRYGVLVNGAMLYDFERRETVERAEIPNARALEIIDFMDTLPISYDCYFHTWGYIDREKLERVEEFISDPGILRLVHELRTPVDNLRRYLAEQGDSVQKLQMYFKPETFPLREQLLQELPARWPDIAVTSSLPMNIELNAAAANKGRALLSLCAHLGIAPEETVAFGDGSNDCSLLRAAGLGVAMANAVEEAKAAADLVTVSNNEAGVAKVLEEIL